MNFLDANAYCDLEPIPEIKEYSYIRASTNILEKWPVRCITAENTHLLLSWLRRPHSPALTDFNID